eukprot:5277660-Pyramimonas_sp.AAC.1
MANRFWSNDWRRNTAAGSHEHRWRCGSRGCAENLSRFWFCKQCGGLRSEVMVPPRGAGGEPDSLADGRPLPVGPQGGGAKAAGLPQSVVGKDDLLSDAELGQLVLPSRKMGNEAQAADRASRQASRQALPAGTTSTPTSAGQFARSPDQEIGEEITR